jgi:hypothetical protein
MFHSSFSQTVKTFARPKISGRRCLLVKEFWALPLDAAAGDRRPQRRPDPLIATAKRLYSLGNEWPEAVRLVNKRLSYDSFHFP